MTLASKIINLNSSFLPQIELPSGVSLLYPYQSQQTLELSTSFYQKYYSDNNKRIVLFGINPGRFGAGLTGIPFTDPILLVETCGIVNDLPKKSELSAQFINQVIAAFGGPSHFYAQFYISSVFPLGFIKDNKNLNYYDINSLKKAVRPLVVEHIKQQLTLGISTQTAYCLGEGANYKFLAELNKEHGFFTSVVPLPHPRYIMQYKRKFIAEFVELYVKKLSEIA